MKIATQELRKNSNKNIQTCNLPILSLRCGLVSYVGGYMTVMKLHPRYKIPLLAGNTKNKSTEKSSETEG